MTNHRCEMALWIGFFLSVSVFVFASAVQVDFVDPSVPLSQAWNSMSLERALRVCREREYVAVFGVSMVAMIVYTICRSWRMRLGALTAGLLMPAFAMGRIMFLVMFMSPLMVLGALAGGEDGEFYEEGILQIGAMGLWMLLCLGFGVREALAARRTMKLKRDVGP